MTTLLAQLNAAYASKDTPPTLSFVDWICNGYVGEDYRVYVITRKHSHMDVFRRAQRALRTNTPLDMLPLDVRAYIELNYPDTCPVCKQRCEALEVCQVCCECEIGE